MSGEQRPRVAGGWGAYWGGVTGEGVKAGVQPLRAVCGGLEHRDPAGGFEQGESKTCSVLGRELGQS